MEKAVRVDLIDLHSAIKDVLPGLQDEATKRAQAGAEQQVLYAAMVTLKRAEGHLATYFEVCDASRL